MPKAKSLRKRPLPFNLRSYFSGVYTPAYIFSSQRYKIFSFECQDFPKRTLSCPKRSNDFQRRSKVLKKMTLKLFHFTVKDFDKLRSFIWTFLFSSMVLVVANSIFFKTALLGL